MIGALKAAHEAIKIQVQAQLDLASKVEKAFPKREYCHEVNDEELRADMMACCYQPCYEFALTGNANKHEREDAFAAILDNYMSKYTEEEIEEKSSMAKRYFSYFTNGETPEQILSILAGNSMNVDRQGERLFTISRNL